MFLKITKPGKFILFDLFALLFLWKMPAIIEVIHFPLYVLEPMRVLIYLAIAHTHRKNVYVLVFIFPSFSYITAMHPSLLKSALLAVELAINTSLLYYLLKKRKEVFTASSIAILIAKTAYYSLKFAALSLGLIEGVLLATPVIYQLIILVSVGLYLKLLTHLRKYPQSAKGSASVQRKL